MSVYISLIYFSHSLRSALISLKANSFLSVTELVYCC